MDVGEDTTMTTQITAPPAHHLPVTLIGSMVTCFLEACPMVFICLINNSQIKLKPLVIFDVDYFNCIIIHHLPFLNYKVLTLTTVNRKN